LENYVLAETSRKRVTAVGLGILTAAAPLLDASAAWELVPEVGLITEVDDNARIVSSEQESSTRAALDAQLRLRNFGQRGEVFIQPRIVSDAYADARDAELENNDIYLLTAANRSFRNSRVEFQSDYRRESILRSEFGDVLNDDPVLGEDPIDTGAGTFGTFTDERERFDLGLNYERGLSDRTRLRLESTFIDVAYLDNQSTTRSDFESSTFAAVLTRLVDERNEVSARVYTSDFTAARNDNDTSTFGVEGSFTRPLSQTWSFELDAGVARNDFSFLDAGGLPVENANSSFTFGFAFNRRSPSTSWTLGANRSLSPGSDGFLAEREDLRAQYRYRFTPRLSLASGVRIAKVTRAVGSFGEQNERDYSRASLEIEWFLTPRWLLTSGADRVTQELLGTGTDATSTSVFVGVRHRGLARQ
jgi:hypothetical protein